jgi:hypothetical protein
MKFRLAIGRTREAAVALCRRTPFACLADGRLRDIFSRGIREQMGGMTSL